VTEGIFAGLYESTMGLARSYKTAFFTFICIKFETLAVSEKSHLTFLLGTSAGIVQ